MTIVSASSIKSEYYSYRTSGLPYGEWWMIVEGDCRIYHAYASSWNGSYTEVYRFAYGLYVFLNLDVPRGTVLGATYLSIPVAYVSGTPQVDVVCSIKARAEDDCPIPANCSYPTSDAGTAWAHAGVPKTEATASFVIPSSVTTVGTVITSSDISAVLQEVINRPGWVAGNRIGLYIYWTGSETLNGSDTRTYNFTSPEVDYTVSAPVLSGVAGPGPKQNTLSVTGTPGAASYNVYWSTSPGVTSSSAKITGPSFPFLHSGLIAGATYYYAVSAIVDGMETGLSNEVALTTFGATESSGLELIGQARLSLNLNEEIDAFDVFSTLNSAVGSYLFNDHQGKYRFVVYAPPTGASLPQFTEGDIFSFSEEVDATAIISKVKSSYCHRVLQDYWQVQFAERTSSQYLQGSKVPVLKEIESPFVQSSDGLKIAQRTVLHEGVPQRIYKARVSAKAWTLLPSDFIQVTYDRHGINGIFEIIETKRDLSTGLVDLTLGGLRGVVGGGASGGFGYPGHWCSEDSFTAIGGEDGAETDTESDGAETETDSDGASTYAGGSLGAPNFPDSLGGGPASPWDRSWSNAQKAYAKQNFGYWCDENGFADPLDPESFLPSTWI